MPLESYTFSNLDMLITQKVPAGYATPKLHISAQLFAACQAASRRGIGNVRRDAQRRIFCIGLS